MSIDALSWAWKQDVDTPVSMCVLLHLADSANDMDGLTYYSLSAIAKRCRCHRTTVMRQLQILSDQGYITLVKKAAVGKSGNTYRVNYHQSEVVRTELEKQRTAEADQSLSATTQPNDEVVAQNDQSQRATSSAEVTGGSRERPLVVAQSDTNPNLLTQNKRPTRARGQPVDKSESLENFSNDVEPLAKPLAPPTLQEKCERVIAVFVERGYKREAVTDDKSIEIVKQWLQLGLGQDRLDRWLTKVAKAVGGKPPGKPVLYLEERLIADLQGKPADQAEITAQRLRKVNTNYGREGRDEALKAAGVSS